MRELNLIVLSLVCSTVILKGTDAQGVESIHSRLMEISYVARVDEVPQDAKELKIWIPLPRSNDQQEIDDIEIRGPETYRITTEPKYGNRMVFFSVSNPPSEVEVEIRFKAKRFECSPHHRSSKDEKLVGYALQAEELVPLSDDIRARASKYTAGRETVKEKARALYDHTLEHMKYDKSGTGWGRGDYRFACDVGTGNCTDFHAYFIGLCRNIGIPAYFEIGLTIPTDAPEGETGAYHCWAYYWDDEWIPVDISEADKHPQMSEYFFGNHDENRLAFSIGRDLVLEPPQNGEPLNYFIFPYAEVDGRVHDKVSKITSYKNM